MSSMETLPPTARLPRSLQSYFEVSLYLLVFTGFITLASTGGLGMVTVVVVGAAFFARGFLMFRGRAWLLSENWTSFLTLGYVVFYLADYFFLSGGFLNATVHLVLFVMVVRLFSAHRDRDFYFLSVIAFLMVLTASLLTVDSVFLLAFAAFMLMAVVAFILMEIRQTSARTAAQSRDLREGRDRNIAISLAIASPALVFSIFIAGAVIFFFLPRISSGYLSAFSPSGEITTGFSDQVDLGRIGEIQQSNSVVMHIQIDADERGSFDLKWRGVALANFDGRTWSNNREQHPLSSQVDGSFALPAPRGDFKMNPARPIHYRVLVEPVGMNIFFLAAAPRNLEGNYRHVAMDDGGAVFDLDPEHPVSGYQATSDIAQPAASELRLAGSVYPAEIRSNYLGLNSIDARIPKLAAQITASGNNQYDKAAALETYLRTHFAYSLQLPHSVPHDPVANFLFERKQGHCEYFASSMAIMLRTLGIPSRLVNGFRTGEFNDLSSQYVVRASNAHSWVEAYFPGNGWIAFDPTPAASIPARTGWSRALLYFDAAATFWRDWVVNYDAGHQQILAAGASSSGRHLFWSVKHWWHRQYKNLLAAARRTESMVSGSPLRWIIATALLAAFLVLAGNGSHLWQALARRRLASKPEKYPRQAASIWYERMTEVVARRGWRKSPTQTPGEFVLWIDDAAIRAGVAKFTRHYENARFDNSAEDARCLPHLYEEIATTRRG